MDRARWSSGLLEREGELRVLAGVLDAVGAGRGGSVLVEGPAGIGKSSLLKACAERAGERGMQILTARGDELAMDSSFAAVRELFWPAVRSGAANLRDGAPRLAAPVFEPEPAAPDRERTSSVLHGLYWLVEELAERGPIVLLIDDAQWLDAASARFAAYLGSRIDATRVLIVIGLRTGERSEPAEAALALRNLAATSLRPAALSEAASAAVVREVVGPRADHEFCRSCYEVTRGNPFYLRELAVAIRAEGARPSIEVAKRVRSLGAAAISKSVLIRLARLGGDCERLAQALCVLGPSASLRHAANLARLDRDKAMTAADAMHAAELLTAGPSLSFIHPIVSEAISSQLAPARRAALHAEAARLLIADGASTDRVAAHLLSAEPYGEEWLVVALRKAAREALARGAPEAAVMYLRRALAEPPSADDRLDVLIELGRAEALLPVAQDFTALREALEFATEPEKRAQIALELALALFGVVRNSDATAVLEEVLERHRDELSSETVERLEQPIFGAGVDDLAAAPRILARTKPYFDRVDRGERLDPRMLASLSAAAAQRGAPPVERAAALAQQAIEDERLRTLWLDDGYVTACWVLVLADCIDESARAIEGGLAEAQRRGSAPMFMQLTLVRASAAFRAGQLDVAEDYAARSFDLSVELGAEAAVASGFVPVLLERGEIARAEELIDGLAIPYESSFGMDLLANRGRVRVARGQLEPGLTDLMEANARTAAATMDLSVMVDWVPAASEALSKLGRGTEARALVRAELNAAARFGAPRRYGIALSVAGSLDPGEEGLRLLRQAVAVLERSPARLEHARALVNLGSVMRGLGSGDEARAVLASGLDLAHQCGGLALAERAHAELVASGARPRRAALSGPQSLTPAELRTARMAADGLSNRQIAQALFLSTKTVETQLYHAYAKLGISSRSELAAALAGD